MERIEIYHDNFQNFKRYDVPKAQLILTDVPYNLSDNAYASNPMWYKDRDIKNGETDKDAAALFGALSYIAARDGSFLEGLEGVIEAARRLLASGRAAALRHDKPKS